MRCFCMSHFLLINIPYNSMKYPCSIKTKTTLHSYMYAQYWNTIQRNISNKFIKGKFLWYVDQYFMVLFPVKHSHRIFMYIETYNWFRTPINLLVYVRDDVEENVNGKIWLPFVLISNVHFWKICRFMVDYRSEIPITNRLWYQFWKIVIVKTCGIN